MYKLLIVLSSLSLFQFVTFESPAFAQNTVTTPGGTTSTVPKFTGTATIASSAILEQSGNADIGTLNNVQFVDCIKYSCSPDIAIGITGAYNALPSTGGTIRILGAASCYTQKTAVSFSTVGKPVIIQGDGANSSCINFAPTSGSGTAFLLDWGTSARTAYGLRDIQLQGPGTGSSTVGVQLGSSNGADTALLDGIKVEGFGTGVSDSNTQAFLITLRKSTVSGNKVNLSITNAVENFNIEHSVLSNFSAANEAGCLSVSDGDVNISDTSLDSCQLAVSGLANVTVTDGHMENPNHDAYDFVSFTGSNSVRMEGVVMLQDLTTAPNPEQISINGNGTFIWANSFYFSGAMQTNFIKIVGGNPNIYSYGDMDGSAAYSAVWLGGGTSGKIALLPQPTDASLKLSGPSASLNIQGPLQVGSGSGILSSGTGGTMASQGADINSANQVTNAHLSGAVAPGGPLRFQITDFGQCGMSSGTCAQQSFGSTYTGAPLCFATWTGVGTLNGQIKIASTTTKVTPSSTNGSDTAQVNWICFGN